MAAAAPTPDRTDHGKRVLIAWVVLSVIATPLVVILLGSILPPGNASDQAHEQVFTNTVILGICVPIICLLLVFFVYALTQFRHRGGQLVDGPPLRNDTRVQTSWLIVTSVTVLFLAGFGTYALLQTGSGGGQGPNPLVSPSGKAFQVQVIAQQWQFTYRYPSLGGMETAELVLPAHTNVALHVTSLDAIHSFWAVELGVKADANPGVDNVAYVVTRNPLTFHVRCAELCGLFHGYMFDNGQVMDQSQFASWVAGQKKIFAAVAKYMPPFSHAYFPDPQRRAG